MGSTPTSSTTSFRVCPLRRALRLRAFIRSPAEYIFRLRQEAHNLLGYVSAPKLPASALGAEMEPILPDGKAAARTLAGNSFEAQIVQIADSVLEGRIPIFDREIEVGSDIRWSRDCVNGIEWRGAQVLRAIPFLDASKVGDHKFIWEINRH